MTKSREEQGDTRTISSSEFLGDAPGTLRRAAAEGPVTVMDESGSPRMAIHCPREKLPVDVD